MIKCENGEIHVHGDFDELVIDLLGILVLLTENECAADALKEAEKLLELEIKEGFYVPHDTSD